jgi:anti-sigma factor RsiW
VTPTCREVLEFLGDYVADELPPERREAFERHLARCTSCVAYLASYRETIRAVRNASAIEIEDVPAEVIAAILRTVA